MKTSKPLQPLLHRLLLSSLFNSTSNSHCPRFFRIKMSFFPLHDSLPSTARRPSPSWGTPTSFLLSSRSAGHYASHFPLLPRTLQPVDSPLLPPFAKGPAVAKPSRALSGLQSPSATQVKPRSISVSPNVMKGINPLFPLASTHSLAVTSHMLKSLNSSVLTAPWIKQLLTKCAHTIVPTEWHSKCPEKPIPKRSSWRRPPKPVGPRLLLLHRRLTLHHSLRVLLLRLPSLPVHRPLSQPPLEPKPPSDRPQDSTSTMTEGAPSSSRQVSSPQSDPPTFWDYGPPLTMFSENPHLLDRTRTSAAPLLLLAKTRGKARVLRQ